MLVSGSTDRSVRVWDHRKGPLHAGVLRPHVDGPLPPDPHARRHRLSAGWQGRHDAAQAADHHGVPGQPTARVEAARGRLAAVHTDGPAR